MTRRNSRNKRDKNRAKKRDLAHLFVKGGFLIVNDDSVVKLAREGFLIVDDLLRLFNKV